MRTVSGKSQLLRAMLVTFLAGISPAGKSAEITSIQGPGSGSLIIKVEGKIESGDEVRFRTAMQNKTVGVVLFSSPGGNLVAGLRIGDEIRNRKFSTAVMADAECASACALAWLAGLPRQIQAGGKIGFHAAFIDGPDGRRETGAGNALIGAYLERLKMNEWAVVYLTSAPPEGMQWLTKEDGERVGIEFAVREKGAGFERRPQVRQSPVVQLSPEGPPTSSPGEVAPNLPRVSLTREQFETALQRTPIGAALEIDRPTDFRRAVQILFDGYTRGGSLKTIRPQLFSIAAPYIWEKLAQADDVILVEWHSYLYREFVRRAPRDLRRCARNDHRQLVQLSMSDEQVTTFVQKLFRPQVGRKSLMSEEQAKELISSVMTSVINRNRERILARAPLYNNDRVRLSQSLDNPTNPDEIRLVCDLKLEAEKELVARPDIVRAAFARLILGIAKPTGRDLTINRR